MVLPFVFLEKLLCLCAVDGAVQKCFKGTLHCFHVRCANCFASRVHCKLGKANVASADAKGACCGKAKGASATKVASVVQILEGNAVVGKNFLCQRTGKAVGGVVDVVLDNNATVDFCLEVWFGFFRMGRVHCVAVVYRQAKAVFVGTGAVFWA